MDSSETKLREERIYDLFRIGVLVKGVQAAVELVVSIFIFFIPLSAIAHLADRFTEAELGRDPDDFVANHLIDFAHNLSIGAKEYAALYLFLHAVTKLILVAALLSGKRWAYPVGLVVLGLLISYQLYRIFLHHSPLLAVATLFDCIVFYLIWREYRIVERRNA